jgi:putative oxidoreductase
MAVAYFWVHAAGSGELFWWANGGELPMVYAFLWLYIAARGPGSFSMDAWIERRRRGTAGAAAGETPL